MNAAAQTTNTEASKTPTEAPSRVAIFFDVPNIYGAAKNQHNGKKVDLIRLRKALVDRRRIVVSNAYFATPVGVDLTTVRNILIREGFEVFHKEMKFSTAAGGLIGNWVVQIATDATDAAHLADTVILVTGRGDFADLARSLKNNGIRVEVCAFESSLSNDLRDAADAVVPITTEYLR